MGRESLAGIGTKIDNLSIKFDRKISNLHEKVNDTNLKVAKIEEHLSNMNGSIEKQQIKTGELDGRVRWLENKFYIAVGGATVIGSISGVVIHLLGLW